MKLQLLLVFFFMSVCIADNYFCNKKGRNCGWYYLNDTLCKNLGGKAVVRRGWSRNYAACSISGDARVFIEWCEKDGTYEACNDAVTNGRCHNSFQC
ncbi:MAG: hypothetical protein JOS17DRAFT_758735 [Linnemannia elongata]|nr:MAG: hypothetical protein JOS17DRAFT_758735 [Linnemannia elongata]